MSLEQIRNIFYKIFKEREDLPERVRAENSAVLETFFNSRMGGVALVYAAEAGISEYIAFDLLLQESRKRYYGEKK